MTDPGQAQHRLHVEVWSDVACPWSHVGKRRLERAVHGFDHPGEVLVRHRCFELDPDRSPAERVGVRQHLVDKYGPAVAQETMAALQAAGREDGVSFDFDRAVRTGTFDAHRMCCLGLEQGGPAQQSAVLERLLRAHFVEGKLLDDRDTLQRLGAEAGLDERRLAAVLAGDAYAVQVREDEALARSRGVTSVPFVVVNDTLTAVGAQPVEELVTLLRRAWHELGS